LLKNSILFLVLGVAAWDGGCPILARFVRKGGIPRQRPAKGFCICFWVAQQFTAAVTVLFFNPASQVAEKTRLCSCLWVAQRFTAAITIVFSV